MKKIALYAGGLKNDEIFDETSPGNRDNCFLPSILLKKQFEEKNIELHTIDYYKKNNIVPDAVIYSDIVKKDPVFNEVDSYLILCECEVIMPKNWDKKSHEQFKHVFTWHELLVDNKKYLQSNIFTGIINPLQWNNSNNKKLCVLINGNKFAHHPYELYSARKKVINWFEKNHPNDFDLYGFGWDTCRFTRWPWRVFNRTPYLKKWLAKKYRCYCGSVASKYTTLNQYKFCICFENAKNIQGYITEKIWDAFTAGCVPVYWGAPNITDYIPADCFIDYTQFKDNAAMYDFLKNMPDEQYQGYLAAIKKFIASDVAKKQGPEYFSRVIVDTVLADFSLPERC